MRSPLGSGLWALSLCPRHRPRGDQQGILSGGGDCQERAPDEIEQKWTRRTLICATRRSVHSIKAQELFQPSSGIVTRYAHARTRARHAHASNSFRFGIQYPMQT